MSASMSTSSLSSSELTASPAAKKPRWLRVGMTVAGSAALLTGLIGVMHMPFAAPLLRKVLPGVCPITRGTPDQIDRAHALGAAGIRSTTSTAAPARPALVFQLDVTRQSDLAAWAAKHGISCTNISGNQNLQRCTRVPAAAVGQPSELAPLEEVTFEFQKTGELVNVQTMRRQLTPQQAVTAVTELERQASTTLGQPSTVGGTPTAAHLARGVLSTYVATHAFNDYRATISATNLAPTGIMVREEYLSAR